MMHLARGTSWSETFERARSAAPEAFAADRILNLIDGEWTDNGVPGEHVTPVDGTRIPGPPFIDLPSAQHAVSGAVREHHLWSGTDLDERRLRVLAAVDAMQENRDLLAMLLVWEVGKTWRLACGPRTASLQGGRQPTTISWGPR